MKNGIIIDGKQYELQELSGVIGFACEYCDLHDECDLLNYRSMNLCEVLHNGGTKHAYIYIGKEEEK